MNEHLPECPVWRCCKPDERATMHMCICPDDERIGGLITRQRAEQIGRNIGQYGCVIPEQQHLPECLALLNDSTWNGACICDALKACEVRVTAAAVQRVEATVGEWGISSDAPALVRIIKAIKGDQP